MKNHFSVHKGERLSNNPTLTGTVYQGHYGYLDQEQAVREQVTINHHCADGETEELVFASLAARIGVDVGTKGKAVVLFPKEGRVALVFHVDGTVEPYDLAQAYKQESFTLFNLKRKPLPVSRFLNGRARTALFDRS